MTAFRGSIQTPVLSFMNTPCYSASSAAPPSLDALLAHLLASWFAHVFVQPLLRPWFAMPLARGVDWPAAGARGRGSGLFRHEFLPRGFDVFPCNVTPHLF